MAKRAHHTSTSTAVPRYDLDHMRGMALFTYNGDAIVDLDPSGVIVAFNPVAEIIFACHPEEVLGKPVAVLLPGRSQQEVAALLADLAARPQVVPYVTDYLRSNGDMLQLSVTAVPLSYPDGTSGGLTVIVRDLTPSLRVATELESRDALYRTIVETAHEGIAIFDRDLVVRFANPRLGSMVGYDIEELVGSSVTSLLYPDDIAGLTSSITLSSPDLTIPTEAYSKSLRNRSSCSSKANSAALRSVMSVNITNDWTSPVSSGIGELAVNVQIAVPSRRLMRISECSETPW